MENLERKIRNKGSKRPLIDRISQWGSRTEILYKCPNCDTSFAIFGRKELFCHNCGQGINYENVPTHIKKPLDEYGIIEYADVKAFIDEFNKKIQNM